MTRASSCAAAILLWACASFAQAPAPAPTAHPAAVQGPVVLTVDPAQSTVHWSVESSLHTVHGTFQVKRGSVTIDPATGKAKGEIVVDATTGQSGNDSRDRRMHKEILESGQYAEVIFRPDHVDGTVAAQGNSDLKLHGVFTLHGSDHDFTAPAQAQLNSNRWKGSAVFTVPYIEWKLKNPSNFLLKVKPEVEIHIDLAGSLTPAAK
ncbi:MAG TPA: YceI family protein [Candidatus Acidoferrum sp.]|jgi:polyisoprenoid-binding protein YceI